MKKAEQGFVLVKGELLPEVFRKTIWAKELLKKGHAKTINDAVSMVGMSRSAYYKYRDGVFSLAEAVQGKILTLTLELEHKSGVLSRVLNLIALAKGNIRTINQDIPVQGIANATVSFETAEMQWDIGELMEEIRKVNGVKKVDLVGQE